MIHHHDEMPCFAMMTYRLGVSWLHAMIMYEDCEDGDDEHDDESQNLYTCTRRVGSPRPPLCKWERTCAKCEPLSPLSRNETCGHKTNVIFVWMQRNGEMWSQLLEIIISNNPSFTSVCVTTGTVTNQYTMLKQSTVISTFWVYTRVFWETLWEI